MHVDIYLGLAGPPSGEDPVTGMVEVSDISIYLFMCIDIDLDLDVSIYLSV